MHERIPVLIFKYFKGELSKEEKVELDIWRNKNIRNKTLFEELLDEEKLKIRLQKFNRREKDVLWNNVLKEINSTDDLDAIPVKQLVPWYRIVTVASVLIFISIISYLYSTKHSNTQVVEYRIQNDVAPGGNKAILTLADGRKISLTDASNGALAEQSGIRITKTSDGQLIYEVGLSQAKTGRFLPAAGMTFNTIETPRGGQYRVILPDGTNVWLNAESSLKYPASFALLKERRVELNGEAYFEVAKDKNLPFIVKTDKQEVEVLGTHFNVNNYADEPTVKTTLLEGLVKVSQLTTNNSQFLKHGQQSILTNNSMSVSEVNIEQVIAWKNGYFHFDDEKLGSIMRKIARWYNVKVTWQDETLKNELFGAVTTRFANVSSLLKMMEQTGDVEFNIEDREIIVSKKR